jgi:1-deoxy-D-xylulose-5-phosphate reductoisomerase
MGGRGVKKVALIGSTGSIGENALEVIRASAGALQATVLCAGSNVSRLIEQVREFRPSLAVIAEADGEEKLNEGVAGLGIEAASGEEGVLKAATFPETDVVLSAVVGAAGIVPAYRALEAGKDLALANKETLVAAGEPIMAAARKWGRRILPVDSEHSALFQTLDGRDPACVREIVLTASGGPFWSDEGRDMWCVTPADALRHPRWEMGEKISIDSATMMNKGLEVIEARWLFGFDLDRIGVMVHPQSIVHSVVEFVDGSMMAHLSRPDMRLPIAAALYYPEKPALPWPRLDLAEAGRLEFIPPDRTRFPALDLARRAEAAGGGVSAVLNAANEVAVQSFLDGRIRFPEIVSVSARVVDGHPGVEGDLTIEKILALDGSARRQAEEVVDELYTSRRR